MPTVYVPAPDVTMLEAIFTLNGSRVENTLYYKRNGDPFNASAPTAAALYISALWNNLRPICSQQIALVEIYQTDLATQTGPTLSYTTGLPLAGTVNTDAEANGVALVVSLRTAGRGRSARGRNYIAGIAEGNVVSSVFTQATVDTAELAYGAWIAALGEEGLAAVVVSRFNAGAPRSVALTQYVNAAVVTNAGTRSQRRRNPGIGT